MDWTAQGGPAPQLYEDFLVPAMFAPCARELVSAAGLRPGMSVLDVACGTGALSRTAARSVGPHGAVTGVDLGAPMLAVARARPVEDAAAPIKYIEGSAESPSVAAGAFDAVTCQQGLQFFEDRPAALRAMHAALAPGGRVAIATWTALEEAVGMSALADGLALHLSEEAGARMHGPWALADAGELHTLLEGAGFADVQVTRLTLDTRFALGRGDFARTVVLAGPLAQTFAQAAPEDQERVAAHVRAALAAHEDGEGGVRFPMSTNVALATRP